MARYLSPEWVQSFDAALGALDLHDAIAQAGAGSLAAADGTFSVLQVVTGAPDGGGDRRLLLRVAEGRAHLSLDTEGTASGSATIVLGYEDALALAHGRARSGRRAGRGPHPCPRRPGRAGGGPRGAGRRGGPARPAPWRN